MCLSRALAESHCSLSHCSTLFHCGWGPAGGRGCPLARSTWMGGLRSTQLLRPEASDWPRSVPTVPVFALQRLIGSCSTEPSRAGLQWQAEAEPCQTQTDSGCTVWMGTIQEDYNRGQLQSALRNITFTSFICWGLDKDWRKLTFWCFFHGVLSSSLCCAVLRGLTHW